MKKIFFALAAFLPLNYYTQIDSSYIGTHDQKISIRPYFGQDFLMMNVEVQNKEKTFTPNNPPKIGLGLSIKNTIIDFSYGYGADFMRDKDYGKTKSLDFQIHNYGRRIALDLFIQKYEGFYDDEPKITELYPDLEVSQYGVHAQYVFNHKKFSYKAAFNQNEKQLKSAGSFLLGIGAYKTKIVSDSSFVYNGKNSFDNFQFGVSGGYAHTWVLRKHWTINASATIGINFGNEKIDSFGKQKIEVYPTVFPRISAVYNRDSWALAFTYIGNVTYPSFSDNSSISILSGGFQISYIKRFNLPSSKKNN